MRYQKEFEDLHKFCIDLVDLRKYHHYALLNLNLNWSKHLETQDCESLWQTILNIRTFTKLHEDTNNYLQGLMASFHNITSKLSIESLSESEESFVLYKQEVPFNQLKELSSICEKAGNKFGEIKEIFAICLTVPTVLEHGSQDEIFRLSQNLKWLYPTIYKVAVPVNNTISYPSTELESSNVSCDSVTVTDNNDQKTKVVFNDQNKESKSKQKSKSKPIKKHGKFQKLHSQRLHKMKHKLLLLDGIRTQMPKNKRTLTTKLLKIDHILEYNTGTCYTMQQLQCKLLPQRPKVKIKYK